MRTMEQKKIKVLIVEPNKAPYAKEIAVGLNALQDEIGGNIQAVYPFKEPVALLCDDEGKVKEKPLNRILRDEQNKPYDVIAGTFLIVGLGEQNFVSLDSKLLNYFLNKFKVPEVFIPSNYEVDEPIKVSVLRQLRQEPAGKTKASPPKKREPER